MISGALLLLVVILVICMYVDIVCLNFDIPLPMGCVFFWPDPLTVFLLLKKLVDR